MRGGLGRGHEGGGDLSGGREAFDFFMYKAEVRLFGEVGGETGRSSTAAQAKRKLS